MKNFQSSYALAGLARIRGCDQEDHNAACGLQKYFSCFGFLTFISAQREKENNKNCSNNNNNNDTQKRKNVRYY